RGAAILVTTHYLEEAEQCNRLGLLVAGDLVAEGTPSELKASQRGHLLELVTDQPDRASHILQSAMDRCRVSRFGDRLHVIVDAEPEEGIRNVTARLASDDIRVLNASEEPPSIEDIFIGIVERRRAEGNTAEAS